MQRHANTVRQYGDLGEYHDITYPLENSVSQVHKAIENHIELDMNSYDLVTRLVTSRYVIFYSVCSCFLQCSVLLIFLLLHSLLLGLSFSISLFIAVLFPPVQLEQVHYAQFPLHLRRVNYWLSG